jgi:hypothetical protein
MHLLTKQAPKKCNTTTVHKAHTRCLYRPIPSLHADPCFVRKKRSTKLEQMFKKEYSAIAGWTMKW